MNKLFFASILVVLIIDLSVYSQEIPSGAILIDENAIVKDESGNVVEMNVWTKYLESGDWILLPVEDKEGELLYLKIRKATVEEKRMMRELPLNIDSCKPNGERAPEFEIVDINGKVIASDKLKGKVLVLNFWFTTCKPCVAEIPQLNEVYEEFKTNENVVFISVTFEKSSTVRRFILEKPIKYQLVTDAQHICKLFDVKAFPTNIIIDKDGLYSGYIQGGAPDIGEHIAKLIREAIKDFSLPVNTK